MTFTISILLPQSDSVTFWGHLFCKQLPSPLGVEGRISRGAAGQQLSLDSPSTQWSVSADRKILSNTSNTPRVYVLQQIV